jgi:hypothetical protein
VLSSFTLNVAEGIRRWTVSALVRRTPGAQSDLPQDIEGIIPAHHGPAKPREVVNAIAPDFSRWR